MHKDEAALGFKALSDGIRVKIVKKLYNKGSMDFNTLILENGIDEIKMKEALAILLDSNLVILDNNIYSANKDYINTLLDFIKTPCGCMRK